LGTTNLVPEELLACEPSEEQAPNVARLSCTLNCRETIEWHARYSWRIENVQKRSLAPKKN
jgi:hypothetical protein